MATTTTVQLQPVLKIMIDGKVTVYPLDQSRYEIGRSIQCSIRINHKKVSRLQATLVRDQHGHYQIQDGDGLGTESSNGTYVNGTRIKHRVLQIGDVIHLGSNIVKALFNYEQPETPEIPEIDSLPVDDEVSTELIFFQLD